MSESKCTEHDWHYFASALAIQDRPSYFRCCLVCNRTEVVCIGEFCAAVKRGRPPEKPLGKPRIPKYEARQINEHGDWGIFNNHPSLVFAYLAKDTRDPRALAMKYCDQLNQQEKQEAQ